MIWDPEPILKGFENVVFGILRYLKIIWEDDNWESSKYEAIQLPYKNDEKWTLELSILQWLEELGISQEYCLNP